MLKRTVPSGGIRHLTDFYPDQKADGQQDGQRLDGTSREGSGSVGQVKEKEKEKR